MNMFARECLSRMVWTKERLKEKLSPHSGGSFGVAKSLGRQQGDLADGFADVAKSSTVYSLPR